MTDLLDISPADAVLEIGTGLGYQAAILAQLAREVYSIEIIEELGQQAKQRIRELRIANGYHGWSEHAPFDKVIVTAAPDLVPPPLIDQLKNRGKMVVPCRPARCAATRARRQRRQRQGDNERDSAGTLLST
jgi:protein-L-isoaspartate(D-aspartate) O-methyltransferase